jgi:shikimate kinase
MAVLQAKVAKDENNKLASVTHWSLRDPSKYKQSADIVQTFQNPTKETKEYNKKIIESQLNPKAVSENPIAVILMGSPASGKTTVGRPYADKILGGKQVTIIDPDAVKSQLKGYEGWNAGAFHEESSFISEKQIFPMAMGARHNMIIDITGKNTGKVEGMANLLKSWGYKIGIVHVDVNDKNALTRAGKRFAKPNGRYVPYGYIKGSAVHASGTWRRLSYVGIADIGYQIDGNADKGKGQTPRVKETYATAF